MSASLLEGIRVVDLAGEPAAMAGRILAELGADVVLVEPPGGHPLRRVPPLGPDGVSLRFVAWSKGKTVVDGFDGDLLGTADVVIETPGFPGALRADRSSAPNAVWVRVTPFGSDGPRSSWRASDLGVMAASGNMYATGDADRPPVRCTEPSGYAHVGPEVAFAVLTALASGRPQDVDVSMQEAVVVADMCAPSRFANEHFRGERRGANIGRTREIWPCADGFVSFGLRGGKARVPSLQTITRLVAEEGLDAGALTSRDWTAFSHTTATNEELAAIEAPIAAWFARHSMAELYEIACATNLMLAPVNSPREILGSAQLKARDFFTTPGLPGLFFTLRPGGERPSQPTVPARGARAWDGTKLVEFGSGAAGPIAVRYFAEHGATVVRVESRSRPDFLRVYALGPGNKLGLDAAPMFDGLNAGKLGITIDLKDDEGVELAKRLVHWADAVVENFAPRAMRGFGLDYDTLVAEKPDLVMLSSCLNGQTGPHRDYPGFGGQGAALSGYNFLTGWPDREPVGPFGTITDSLSPRFAAAALAAALLHRRRTGGGVHLDFSQVEAGVWSLTPWLLDCAVNETFASRIGNRSERACPHGAFPCAGDDRWVAIAVWDDDEWSLLAGVLGVDDPELKSLEGRLARVDDVEALVAAWTSGRPAGEIAAELQALGIEAVPVADFGDVHGDPQLAHRGHFQALEHPVMGHRLYERNGFRLSQCESWYDRPGPTLGEHNEHVLRELLGMSEAEYRRLADGGALD